MKRSFVGAAAAVFMLFWSMASAAHDQEAGSNVNVADTIAGVNDAGKAVFLHVNPDGTLPVTPAPGAITSIQGVDGGRPVEIIGRDGGMAVRTYDPATVSIDGKSPAPGANTAANSVPIVEALCSSPTNSVTSVGVTSTAVPATVLTGRRFVMVCNSIENSGSPKIKCRDDGTPVMGASAAGTALAPGDCQTFGVTSATTLNCIADTATTYTDARECK